MIPADVPESSNNAMSGRFGSMPVAAGFAPLAPTRAVSA